MTTTIDAVVVGDIFADMVTHIVSYPPNGGSTHGAPLVRTCGGCGGNIAAGLGVLGVRTAIFCRLGNDEAGRYLKDDMAAYGVENRYIVLDEKKSSGIVIIMVDPAGERTIWVLANDAAYEHMVPDDVAPIRDIAPKAVMVSGVLPGIHPTEETVLSLAESLRGETRLYFDPNLRYPPGAVPPALGKAMRRMAELSDVVLAGDTECEALDLRPRRGQVFVMKTGKKGSVLLREDGSREISIPATEHAAVNATGAGDTYAAAFMAAELRGLGVREAMEYATVAAGISVTRPGARCMPSPGEIDAYINRP